MFAVLKLSEGHRLQTDIAQLPVPSLLKSSIVQTESLDKADLLRET